MMPKYRPRVNTAGPRGATPPRDQTPPRSPAPARGQAPVRAQAPAPRPPAPSQSAAMLRPVRPIVPYPRLYQPLPPHIQQQGYPQVGAGVPAHMYGYHSPSYAVPVPPDQLSVELASSSSSTSPTVSSSSSSSSSSSAPETQPHPLAGLYSHMRSSGNS